MKVSVRQIKAKIVADYRALKIKFNSIADDKITFTDAERALVAYRNIEERARTFDMQFLTLCAVSEIDHWTDVRDSRRHEPTNAAAQAASIAANTNWADFSERFEALSAADADIYMQASPDFSVWYVMLSEERRAQARRLAADLDIDTAIAVAGVEF